MASMLQLSKGVREAILPTIESLTAKWKGPALHYGAPARALIRLLRRAPSLQRLSVGDEAPQATVVREIGDETVGGQLQSLSVPYMRWENLTMRALVEHLKAGRMPLLAELDLSYTYEQEALGLASALEYRVSSGLPPLVRLQATVSDVECQRRQWACCPPATVTHLEADGASQVEALREYMQQRDSFPALRSLRLAGNRPGGAGAGIGVFGLLGEGRAPMLEELVVSSWIRAMGPLAAFGAAVRSDKWAKLTSLALKYCEGPN